MGCGGEGAHASGKKQFPSKAFSGWPCRGHRREWHNLRLLVRVVSITCRVASLRKAEPQLRPPDRFLGVCLPENFAAGNQLRKASCIRRIFLDISMSGRRIETPHHVLKRQGSWCSEIPQFLSYSPECGSWGRNSRESAICFASRNILVHP